MLVLLYHDHEDLDGEDDILREKLRMTCGTLAFVWCVCLHNMKNIGEMQLFKDEIQVYLLFSASYHYIGLMLIYSKI